MLKKPAIEKLEKLQAEIISVQKKEYTHGGSSKHSEKMVEQALIAVSQLLKNNDISFWKKNKNQESFFDAVNFIDNNKGIYVPEIFNEQSKDLAKAIEVFLKSLDFKNDIDTSISVILTAFRPQDKLRKLIKNLELSLQLYEELCQNEIFTKKMLNTRHNKIYPLHDEIIKEINDSFSQESYDELKSKYETKIDTIINDTKDMPHLRISGSAPNQPVPISPSDLASLISPRGALSEVIIDLLTIEKEINETLLKNNQPIFTHAYQTIKKIMTESQQKKENNNNNNNSQDNVIAIKKTNNPSESLKKVIAKVENKAISYKNGTHLKWYQKLDSEKTTLMESLTNGINEIVAKEAKAQDPSILFELFEIIKITLNKISEHQKLIFDHNSKSHKMNISSGQCGTILNETVFDLLKVFYQMNPANNQKLQVIMKDYEDKYLTQKSSISLRNSK